MSFLSSLMCCLDNDSGNVDSAQSGVKTRPVNHGKDGQAKPSRRPVPVQKQGQKSGEDSTATFGKGGEKEMRDADDQNTGREKEPAAQFDAAGVEGGDRNDNGVNGRPDGEAAYIYDHDKPSEKGSSSVENGPTNGDTHLGLTQETTIVTTSEEDVNNRECNQEKLETEIGNIDTREIDIQKNHQKEMTGSSNDDENQVNIHNDNNDNNEKNNTNTNTNNDNNNNTNNKTNNKSIEDTSKVNISNDESTSDYESGSDNAEEYSQYYEQDEHGNNIIDLTLLQEDQSHAPGFNTLLPPIERKFADRKCLVLDLDETLVHSSFKYLNIADFVLPVDIDNQVQNVYVIKRPGVDEFLRIVGEIYEVVVFTASVSRYGNPLIDILDTHKSIHHRLFRDSCYIYEGNYVKNLSQIGRPLGDIIILDNSPASYIFHPQHAIPISSWFSDSHDNELLNIIPLLEDLSEKSVLDVGKILDVAI